MTIIYHYAIIMVLIGDKMKKKTWYPLDNAAKVYPAISGPRRPNLFSFSVRLTENVDRNLLEKAVNILLENNSAFKVKMRKGVFWYYLEKNYKPFVVKEEIPNYLGYFDFDEDNNGYLFRIFYKYNKITIVNFHALSDGDGILSFFKSIIAEYLLLKDHPIDSENLIQPLDAPYTAANSEDSFNKEYRKKCKKAPKESRVFKVDGTPFDYDGYGLITAKIDLEGLKTLAKKYDATITEYLVGLYMYTAYNVYIRGKKVKNKVVSILVPANMRKRYPSKTLRNFSLFVRPRNDFGKQELNLEECIATCKKQIKEGLSQERLDTLIHDNVKIEKNFFMKLVPLFIKDAVIRLTYKYVGENLQTGNISNIGIVDLPKSMQKYVTDFTMAIAPTFTCKQQLGAITYNGNIYITSAREFVETTFEREFFTTLSKNNIKVEIFSNNWEARNETL